MLKKMFVLVALAAISVACGGDSPVAPSATTTTTTGKVVGAQSTVTPTPAALPSSFQFVSVGPELFSVPPSELPLWGIRGANSVETAMLLSFCGKGVLSAGENGGVRPLRKPMGPMTIAISPDFSAGEREVMERALSPEFRAQLNVPLELVYGQLEGQGVVNVIRDPSYTGWGSAWVQVDNNLITSGRVRFGPNGVYVSSFRHELGHAVIGLCHSNDPGGLMSGVWGKTQDQLLSKAEADNREMMFRLAEGTLPPGMTSFQSRAGSYTLTFDHQ